MKIEAIEIRDFKRIKHVKIEPGVDKAILLIAGNNAQGKSSVLDALTAAFGGAKQAPSDPVRHGADEAHIYVRTDDGIEIERIYGADGKNFVEVRNADGAKYAGPQAVLDRLVGRSFLDPLKFLALDDKKQRAMVLELADTDRQIPQLDADRKAKFDARTEANRECKTLQTQIDLAELWLKDHTDPGDEINVSENAAALDTLNDQFNAIWRHRERLEKLQRDRDNALINIDRIKRMLADAEHDLVKIEKSIENEGSAKALDEVKAQIDKIKGIQATAHDHNAAVFEWRNYRTAFAKTSVALAHAKDKADKFSDEIDQIDAQKTGIFATAALPAGLTVGDDGLLFQGVTFAQASGAQRFWVALALAMSANPKLGDIWIRDGSLLDDDHLAELAKLATAKGLRFWVERVGTKDAGSILISDGTVVGGAP